jgi:hypothetical protein
MPRLHVYICTAEGIVMEDRGACFWQLPPLLEFIEEQRRDDPELLPWIRGDVFTAVDHQVLTDRGFMRT